MKSLQVKEDGDCKISRIKKSTTIIKDYSPQEIVEIALIENIQRGSKSNRRSSDVP